MTLNIQAQWSRQIDLTLATTGAAYKPPDFETIPDEPGVYVFGRQHGDTRTPLYIGRALSLRRRLFQQFNSVKLMMNIRDAESGKRFLIYSQPSLKPGQPALKVIKVMEDALIAHALSAGYSLLQSKGLKRPTHEITFTGNRTSECIAPRYMRVQA